jgi:hypothetical protein
LSAVKSEETKLKVKPSQDVTEQRMEFRNDKNVAGSGPVILIEGEKENKDGGM